MIDLETFQRLPTEEVARLVREAGTKVCVFAFDGTRRWLALEYSDKVAADFVETYLQIVGKRMAEIFKLLFDHGIDTLLAPMAGPDLIERGNEYARLAAQGFLMFARNPDLLGFYDAYDVRVRFYGDSRRYLQGTPYAYVLDAYDELVQRTVSHCRHRLFFGIFANDATETVAEIGARFHQECGRLPNRHEIVEAYYGEYVEPVSLFIGFGRPAAFDMPLVAIGEEALYFTVSPSPYMSARTLRAILHDYLYNRKMYEGSYATLSREDWLWMKAFYQANLDNVLGVGMKRGGIWYPLPQAQLLEVSKTQGETV